MFHHNADMGSAVGRPIITDFCLAAFPEASKCHPRACTLCQKVQMNYKMEGLLPDVWIHKLYSWCSWHPSLSTPPSPGKTENKRKAKNNGKKCICLGNHFCLFVLFRFKNEYIWRCVKTLHILIKSSQNINAQCIEKKRLVGCGCAYQRANTNAFHVVTLFLYID